jgi:glycogen operon protein
VDGPVDLAYESRCLAYRLRSPGEGGDDLYVMINAHWEDHTFTVAGGRARQWRRVVDTALTSPADIVERGSEPAIRSARYLVRARSVVVLRREPVAPGRKRP